MCVVPPSMLMSLPAHLLWLQTTSGVKLVFTTEVKILLVGRCFLYRGKCFIQSCIFMDSRSCGLVKEAYDGFRENRYFTFVSISY